MLHFLAQESPKSYSDVLLIPVILTFAGAFIFFLGWNQERTGKPNVWKWFAIVPLVFAMWGGWRDVQNAQSPFVKAEMRGKRKLYYSQYVSFGLPLVTALGLIGFSFYDRSVKKGRPVQTDGDVQSSPT